MRHARAWGQLTDMIRNLAFLKVADSAARAANDGDERAQDCPRKEGVDDARG